MYCPKCGTPNDDNSTFCTSCGNKILPAGPAPPVAPPVAQPAAPPMAPPMAQPGAATTTLGKPYKTEFVLGLIGSIVGIVIFLTMFIVGIVQSLSFYYFGGGGIVIGGSILVLAAFILGFIGTAQLNKGKGSGGILLIVGGGLGFIAMFLGIWVGWSTIFFYPLLLAGGIMALARKRLVERG